MGFHELVNGKPKESVPLTAGAHVAAGGDAEWPILVHDVDEHSAAADFSRPDAFDAQRQLFLVVEAGITLIAVQCQLILLGDFPDRNGDRASCLRLDRKVGPGLASFEHQAVVLQFRDTDDPRIGASPAHLLDIEIATIGDVVSFFHGRYHPFRSCLLPPKARLSGFGGLLAASFKRLLCRF